MPIRAFPGVRPLLRRRCWLCDYPGRVAWRSGCRASARTALYLEADGDVFESRFWLIGRYLFSLPLYAAWRSAVSVNHAATARQQAVAAQHDELSNHALCVVSTLTGRGRLCRTRTWRSYCCTAVHARIGCFPVSIDNADLASGMPAFAQPRSNAGTNPPQITVPWIKKRVLL